jgi:hypothetical protein
MTLSKRKGAISKAFSFGNMCYTSPLVIHMFPYKKSNLLYSLRPFLTVQFHCFQLFAVVACSLIFFHFTALLENLTAKIKAWEKEMGIPFIFNKASSITHCSCQTKRAC